MSEIEEFLAKQELFKCERLAASITQQQCEKNRTRKHQLTADVWTVGPCKGCPGLGEKVIMTQGVKQEPTTAASGKSVQPHRLCDVPGCNKFRVIGHKCTNHSKEFLAKTAVNKTRLANSLDIEKETIQQKQPVILAKTKSNEPISEPIPAVTESEIHIINLIDVFKQKQSAELDLFIHELSRQPDPYSKLMYAYHKVSAC